MSILLLVLEDCLKAQIDHMLVDHRMALIHMIIYGKRVLEVKCPFCIKDGLSDVWLSCIAWKNEKNEWKLS